MTTESSTDISTKSRSKFFPFRNNKHRTTTKNTNHLLYSCNLRSPIILIFIAIGLCCITGAVISFIHVHYNVNTAIELEQYALNALGLSDFIQNDNDKEPKLLPASDSSSSSNSKTVTLQKNEERLTTAKKKIHSNNNNVDEPPHYHQLQCNEYGGPSIDDAQEMVYWQDIQSDSHYVSPFHRKKKQQRQYMTFEPDGGGWNNIRMAMETVVGLAIATGRTLVLPPEQRMYLLAKGRGDIKTDFSFADFFPMHELATDNDGLTIITMEEFLITEAMTGNLHYKDTNKVAYPPYNRTNWDGQDVKILKEWLRNVTLTPLWSPSKCLAVFPASGDHKDSQALLDMHTSIMKSNGFLKETFLDKPLPVDATTIERMKESLVQRKEICIYNEQMQNAFIIHFMCSHQLKVRMLVHFYAFLFFEDWREDLWMKRFMRDHMRYIDELQCAAARIVTAIRKRVKEREPNNINGDFDTFHIRRGDFQYKKTRIDAKEIYNNVKNILQENVTVFIATDERKKTFFNDMKKHYNIYFLDDFKDLLKDVNQNHYGMIDQLVASRGRIFFGCWHSTFTGFINRMRGYHSVRDKLPGHEDGLLPNTYYYVPKDALTVMHKYAPLQGAFFNREFPTSWRQLDYGIGNLPVVDQ